MKRYGKLYEQIIAVDNIELAINKAMQGVKKNKKAVKWFCANKEALTHKLIADLCSETYIVSEYNQFTVKEPKERVIYCLPFYPDRIVQHAIMNVLHPLFVEKFTADTYSSIKGRGIHQCARKLKKAIQENEYYLQVDIRKYYPSIDISIMKLQLRRLIKCTRTLKLLDAIIDSHKHGGLPIGNYLSQYLSNYHLSELDHYVKETMRVKHYYRYADDLVLLGHSKAEVTAYLRQIEVKIQALNLTIKNNVRIAPTLTGIDFIGYNFFPTHTLLRKSIKQNLKRKVRRHMQSDDKEFKRQTASHYGWAKHCDSKHLLKTIMGDRIHLYEKI